MSEGDVEIFTSLAQVGAPSDSVPSNICEMDIDHEMSFPSLPATSTQVTTVSSEAPTEKEVGKLEKEVIGKLLHQMQDVIEDSEKRNFNFTGIEAREKLLGAPTPRKAVVDSPVVINLADDDDDIVESMKENINSTSSAAMQTKSKMLHTVRRVVRKLPRRDLEKLVTSKIVECMNAHSTVSILKTKVTRLTINKDRLFQKATSLQKQVTELSKSMKLITDHYARNPKENQKAFVPLKFFRSVGLQVNTPLSRPHMRPSMSVRTPVPPNQASTGSILKQSSPRQNQSPGVGTNAVTSTVSSSSSSGNALNNGAGQGLKRINKPTISVAELRNQVQVDPAKVPRRMGPGPSPVRASNVRPPVQQQINRQSPSSLNPRVITNGNTRPATTTASSSVIDLTGDSKTNNTGTGYNLINQNGVQYRVVNQGGIPQGMQLVTSPSGFHLVNPQGQTRPVVFQQQQQLRTSSPQQMQNRQSSPAQQTQQYAVRSSGPLGQGGVRHSIVTNNTVQRQRPMLLPIRSQNAVQSTGPRLQSSTAGPRLPSSAVQTSNNGQAVIPRNQYNTPASATISSPSKKFVLPDLPQAAVNGQPRRGNKEMPPRPDLTLQEQADGIVLSWTHILDQNHAEILTYQIYACQEPLANGVGTKPQPAQWKRVGDVKALPLPMACTLSQFTDENRYYFIVRGVDIYNRTGPFCEPTSIILKKKH